MNKIIEHRVIDYPRSCLVVARYNEDTSWVDNFSLTTFIVQKDLDRNVGREANSWLQWIICNYTNIYDYYEYRDFVCFLQGNPFDHFTDIDNEKLKHYTDLEVARSYGLDTHNYLSLGDLLECDDNGSPHHRGLEVGKYKEIILGSLDRQSFTKGAQCLVRAVNILNYPLEFWLNLYELSITDSQFAWIMERYWKSLFNVEYKYKVHLPFWEIER